MTKFSQRSGARGLGPLLALALVALVVLAFAALSLRLLRPILDDYCWGAATARDGLIGGMSTWYRTWTGDLVAVGLNTLLVGMPLVYLPWALASAIPTVVAASCVGVLVLVLIWRTSETGHLQRRVYVLLVPIALLLWIAYWWVPRTFGSWTAIEQMADEVSVWQNINAAYVVPTAIVLTAWLVMSRPGAYRRALTWCLACAVLGLFTGLAGYSIAVTALTVVAITTLWRLIRRVAPRGVRLAGGLLFTATTVTGIAISYFSPGAQARAAVLAATPVLPSKTPLSLASWIVPESAATIFRSLTNTGALCVFVIAAVVAVVLRSGGWRADRHRVGVLTAAMAGIAVVNVCVARASEAFAYPAPWHYVGASVVLFAFVVILGVYAGLWVSDAHGSRRLSVWVVVLVGMLAMVPVAFAVASQSARLSERESQWQHTSAPFGDIMDLGTPNHYTTTCWWEIGQARAIPYRTVPFPFVVPQGVLLDVTAAAVIDLSAERGEIPLRRIAR